ncbi:DUF3263 domain-containing protein [Brevibacterium otitidis]|uniref:DUF3263 domain-containing protein n=1 Tax=Brevibacterium otitidis TaxID=53364 RepID=A0ABV5X0X0_9MICO|nr:hypothetical protein GCM10023233_05130 [Brevibacterium otitidis]
MSEQELTELESRVLRFERQWHTYGGAKDGAIRQEFDMSAPAYFQLLNTLLDNPAAYAADPILIKRLRRIRESRHQDRARARMAR